MEMYHGTWLHIGMSGAIFKNMVERNNIMSIYINATHGIACAVLEDSVENYFGWPSVARLGDGTIVAGSSGLRRDHVCPWGKSVVAYSTDGGQTYGDLQVIHNDMVDNRDLGVVAMGGQKYAITWFSVDNRQGSHFKEFYREAALAYLKTWDDDTVNTLLGSWMKITEDGGKSWTRPIRVPVSAPHGFSVMKDGTLGYLGKGYREDLRLPIGPVQYAVSADGGYSWQIRGEVPIPAGDDVDQYHEPHVIELDDGTLLGVIRFHIPEKDGGNLDTCLTFSRDGGRTWTEPKRMNVAGSPPHLLKHSSGAIVMVYGYRHPGYGQRAVVSRDNGLTWSEEIILRQDGPSSDLGYPCSIELDDGSIYTVYYQALPGKSNTSVLWTKWTLPE